MDFIKHKIRVLSDKLGELKTVSREPIPYRFVECPEYKKGITFPGADANWKEAEKFQRFCGKDCHAWIHFTLPPMPVKDGMEPRLSVKTGKEGQWDATNPQFIVYVNGENTQALDVNHTWMPL